MHPQQPGRVSSEGVPRRHTIWITAICLFAALRVFVLAAAFPFFSPVDEAMHVDVILKYARGQFPDAKYTRFDPEVGRLLAMYGSREYRGTRSLAEPPAYALDSDARQRRVVDEAAHLTATVNVETSTPPVYYLLAALWYRAGHAIGLRDLALLYWVRFLNVPLYAFFILLTWKFCIAFLPERPRLAIGVVALLAVFPQDVFYAINSDALAPAAMMTAMWLLADWARRPDPSAPTAAIAGAGAAMALLVKFTNLPLLAVVAMTTSWRLCRAWRDRKADDATRRRFARTLTSVAILFLSFAVPLGAWLLRNRLVFGDFTGSADKIARMGWTLLPLRAALHHPIFTIAGMIEFLQALCVTFWRGELYWQAVPHRVAWADLFFSGATGLAMVAALAGWIIRPSPSLRRERPIAAALLTLLACSVLFLAYLSTRFDYGNSFFPSRGFPYFATGRLMIGALGPFAIVYVAGLDALSPVECRRPVFIALLAITLLVCAASEAIIMTDVFRSPHNWFHLAAIRKAN